MFLSSKIQTTTGYRGAPIANARIWYRGQDYGAILYRGETDPSPGQLPDLNRWMHVFERYNRTAMIGNPQDFRLSSYNRYFWAELSDVISCRHYSDVNTNDYSPGSGDWTKNFISGAPPAVSWAGATGAGVVSYTKSGEPWTVYCVFINGKMVYTTDSSIGACPILITMPYGYALITFSRVYFSGYVSNYIYVNNVMSFTKFGSTKGSWKIGIYGQYGFEAALAGEAGSFSYVVPYDSSGHAMSARSFQLSMSTVPEVEYEDAAGNIRYSQSYAFVFQEAPNEERYRSAYTSGITPLFSMSQTYHKGLQRIYTNLHFYWNPAVQAGVSITEESLKDVNYWIKNPIDGDTHEYANRIPFNALKTSSYTLGLLLLCPGVTSGETDRRYFSNWGVYIERVYNDNGTTTYRLQSYQRGSYFWHVDIGTYSSGTYLRGWYVAVPFDPTRNSSSTPATIYFLFQQGNSVFFNKCTLDRLSHIHSMAPENFTFQRIDLSEFYSFSNKMISMVDSDQYYITFKDTRTPIPAGQKRALAFAGTVAWSGEGTQFFDYKGNQLSPFGNKYSIFGYPETGRFSDSTGFNSIEYDLPFVIMDLDNIQGSLNYMNRN